jgi:putative PIN family toxin of toxin-antitoxin system
MRAVLDTNTIVSGILWRGPPRAVLEAARDGRLVLFTSNELLLELFDVLSRPKFHSRLQVVDMTVDQLVTGFCSLATIVRPATIVPVVEADPDDDAVLACAASAGAEVIVSGDSHLLELGTFDGIPVLSAVECLRRL